MQLNFERNSKWLNYLRLTQSVRIIDWQVITYYVKLTNFFNFYSLCNTSMIVCSLVFFGKRFFFSFFCKCITKIFIPKKKNLKVKPRIELRLSRLSKCSICQFSSFYLQWQWLNLSSYLLHTIYTIKILIKRDFV